MWRMQPVTIHVKNCALNHKPRSHNMQMRLLLICLLWEHLANDASFGEACASQLLHSC